MNLVTASEKDLMEIRQLVNSASWYHSFEIARGIWTPGRMRTDPKKTLNDRFSLPEDLTGKRALDIGALDGPYTFEMERRGAEVTALDIQKPDRTGFNTARKVLNSRARYIEGNVYEIDTLLNGEKFDIITFFGVWYHLKNPILSFERITDVLADNGKLFFEGEILKTYAQLPDGAPVDQSIARTLAECPVPLTLYYSGKYKEDSYSWFVPNIACLNEWLKTAGLKMVHHGFWDDHPHQRLYGIAVKDRNAIYRVDNPVW